MQNQQSNIFTSSQDSITTSTTVTGGSNNVSSRMSNGRKKNTLSREGIAPSNIYSRFGNSRRHPATDQERTADSVFDSKRFYKKRNEVHQSQNLPKYHVKDSGEAMPMFLPRAEWFSLGDGWYQTTPTGTGSTNRFGLHSVIDSSMGQLFICVYEPRTQEGVKACNSENPQYDLSVSVKSLNKHDKGAKVMRQQFDLLFGFKSVTDFFSLTADLVNREWILSRTNGSDIFPLSTVDMDLKANIFYDILLQIRGGTISVDIDSVPIFTSVRFADTIGGSLSGILGVLAKGTKFAIKGWQLRAPNSRNLEYSSAGFDFTAAPHNRGKSPRAPMSLRKSLLGGSNCGDSSELCNDGNYRQRVERRGPPPVPSGGGGPGNSNSHRPLAGGNKHDTITSDDGRLDMLIMRCCNLLKERHDNNIVDLVLRDIVQRDLGVSFQDIAALETAKRLLNEAVVLPLIMPELFTGIRKPWKGVLLFGPPGTGKTMLAKAVADLNNSVFFCCSAASLISKFRGESEKIVKCLFEAARLCAPAVVFLDEIDALVSSRGGEGEHEASRRLKTEFFSQMDGISSCDDNSGSSGVMVLATTNCPWDLDEAIRRRLEKRIYIPLPDISARIELFQICLKNIEVGAYVTAQSLADATEGYSGADIHLVCREAAMMPMRKLLSEYSPQELNVKKQRGSLDIPAVSLRDFHEAIENTKPSVSQDHILNYTLWDEEYGSK